LDYLLKHGSERVVTSAREHIYDLRNLENYTCVDENGRRRPTHRNLESGSRKNAGKVRKARLSQNKFVIFPPD
jgi:hypothetical protein